MYFWVFDYFLRIKRTVNVSVNLPTISENFTAPPYEMHILFIWLKVYVYCFSPNAGCSENSSCDVWQLEQATSHQVFKMTTFCMDTCFQSFSPLINRIIQSTMLCWNSAHVSTSHNSSVSWIGSRYTLLHHAPDVVFYQFYVRNVGWQHVCTDELGCVTAQKLDCVASVMCRCTVLLKSHKLSEVHISSIVENNFLHFLR